MIGKICLAGVVIGAGLGLFPTHAEGVQVGPVKPLRATVTVSVPPPVQPAERTFVEDPTAPIVTPAPQTTEPTSDACAPGIIECGVMHT